MEHIESIDLWMVVNTSKDYFKSKEKEIFMFLRWGDTLNIFFHKVGEEKTRSIDLLKLNTVWKCVQIKEAGSK